MTLNSRNCKNSKHAKRSQIENFSQINKNIQMTNQETDVDLLVPLENLINTDPRVYRTKGLDGLPAVGIQRGVEIVVPYRIYLPRRFYRNFAFLSSIKPRDDRGGFLFAVVNAFDTIVDLGVKLEPAADSQTNISLIYTDSEAHTTSQTIASFIVPSFTNQWTQLAIEVRDDTVTLYFRCMRYATRQVRRQPLQLQLDDASKLYIANAGPIIGAGFEVGCFFNGNFSYDRVEAERQA
ncbi:LAM-G-DOMAIN domain-containing protein [Aphelenchoides bicaudatus]|nr:LAM-G-DOMAIN domain-containing protein [Aphelenchoides bicaudatus]